MGSVRDTDQSCKDMELLNTQRQSHLLGSSATIVPMFNAKEAKRAEEAGASAVSLINTESKRYVEEIQKIKKSVSIPVMAACKIGHIGEACILEAIGGGIIDCIQEFVHKDAPADHIDGPFIDKHSFNVPFLCFCDDLETALKRVSKGASSLMIGSTTTAVIKVKQEISNLNNMDESEIVAFANKICVPYDLLAQTKKLGRLPVPVFAESCGLKTPADAIMLMELGFDGVFLWFSRTDNLSRMVKAVQHYDDPKMLPMLWGK